MKIPKTQLKNSKIKVWMTKHALIEYTKDLLGLQIITEDTQLSRIIGLLKNSFCGAREYRRKNYVQAIINNNFEGAKYFINKEFDKDGFLFVVSENNILITVYFVSEEKIRRNYVRIK